MNTITVRPVFILLTCAAIFSCKEKKLTLVKDIQDMKLKRGALISCGPADKQFGEVQFETSCKNVQADFNLGVKLLHSFEYDEAEKVFAKIIDEEPQCSMAYWGVAMSNFHPLWTPPTEAELNKGTQAVKIANSIKNKTKREEMYIHAIASFYQDWKKTDHHTRCISFEKAMEELYAAYPGDKETAIFYALSLNAAVDPSDKSYARQKNAGAILNELYAKEPNHPGIIHYIIHTYDSPELASLALPAARKYASVAPSSAHALHMPSHIFTRLGLWDECIQSNLASIASAQCYAKSAGIKGHWDEELHGQDYLVYAYLQKGENEMARKQLDYLATIDQVYPVNFKVAYAFAAIPSRYLLENRQWKEAAGLNIEQDKISWKGFPWQEAILHFTRVMGLVHTGNITSARHELEELKRLQNILTQQKDSYKANQVEIQVRAAEAWIRFKEGDQEEALRLMGAAADMEDHTEKHPVTPCEVTPARELLGDLLLEMKKPTRALEEFERSLKKNPNRFNGLYGAGLAAEKSGDLVKAKSYYGQLFANLDPSKCNRPELELIRKFLKLHG